MSEQDEIDLRRAMVLARERCSGVMNSSERRDCLLGQKCNCLLDARAIRESDTASGYILVKHEGIISSGEI